LRRNKSKAQIGNQNSVGNKGGHPPKENKNAVVTGEYENLFKGCFTETEEQLLKNHNKIDTEKELLFELNSLTIRESRMLTRIEELKKKGKDMTINYIRNKKGRDSETITDAEPTINLIQRIEDGLTRVQEAKRKCLDSLQKLNSNEDDEAPVNKTTNALLESINRQLGGGKNGAN
jgi:uncharacterized protein YjcR